MRGAKDNKKERTIFVSLQRVFYFVQSYGGSKHERLDGEAARREKRFSVSISNKVFTVLKNLEMHRAFGVIKRTPGTRPSMQFKRTHTPNLVPRVLSYPPSVGRVGENPGNEVAIRPGQ